MNRRRATWCRWPAWPCRTSSRPRSAWRSRSRWCAASPASAPAISATSGSTWSAARCASCCRSAIVAAIVLIAGGVIQNFHLHDQVVNTLAGGQQTITGGPVASQEAIKELGTNGGGFYNANSAHPFENPTTWTNWVEIFLLLVISFSLPRTFGRMVGSKKQGYAIAAVMATLAIDQRGALMMLFQLQAPRHRADRGRRGHGRRRAAVRRGRLGGVRRRDDADVDRCGRLVPRLLHQPRRHGDDVQHAARRGRARRHRLRPVRHARSSR